MNHRSNRQPHEVKSDKRGITLLLVVVILSALFSISLGIFNLVFGQILISGEVEDSFRAFYAADRGLERIFYRDRVDGGLPDGYQEDNTNIKSEIGCFRITVRKTEDNCGAGNNTCVTSIGQYRCGINPSRVVKRGFSVSY